VAIQPTCRRDSTKRGQGHVVIIIVVSWSRCWGRGGRRRGSRLGCCIRKRRIPAPPNPNSSPNVEVKTKTGAVAGTGSVQALRHTPGAAAACSDDSGTSSSSSSMASGTGAGTGGGTGAGSAATSVAVGSAIFPESAASRGPAMVCFPPLPLGGDVLLVRESCGWQRLWIVVLDHGACCCGPSRGFRVHGVGTLHARSPRQRHWPGLRHRCWQHSCCSPVAPCTRVPAQP
jgi:hypothetical protein